MDPNLSTEEMLQQFVEGVVKYKGAENADVPAMVQELSDKIDEAMVMALPEATMDKIIAMEEDPNTTPEDYEKLLEESGIDQNAVVKQAMEEWRDAYLNDGEEA